MLRKAAPRRVTHHIRHLHVLDLHNLIDDLLRVRNQPGTAGLTMPSSARSCAARSCAASEATCSRRAAAMSPEHQRR